MNDQLFHQPGIGAQNVIRRCSYCQEHSNNHFCLYLPLYTFSPCFVGTQKKSHIYLVSRSTGWLHFSALHYFRLRGEQAARQSLTCEQALREMPFFLSDRKSKRPSPSTHKGELIFLHTEEGNALLPSKQKRESTFPLFQEKAGTSFCLLDRSSKRPSPSKQKEDRFSSFRQKRKTPFYLLNRKGNRLFLCCRQKGETPFLLLDRRRKPPFLFQQKQDLLSPSRQGVVNN